MSLQQCRIINNNNNHNNGDYWKGRNSGLGRLVGNDDVLAFSFHRFYFPFGGMRTAEWHGNSDRQMEMEMDGRRNTSSIVLAMRLTYTNWICLFDSTINSKQLHVRVRLIVGPEKFKEAHRLGLKIRPAFSTAQFDIVFLCNKYRDVVTCVQTCINTLAKGNKFLQLGSANEWSRRIPEQPAPMHRCRPQKVCHILCRAPVQQSSSLQMFMAI